MEMLNEIMGRMSGTDAFAGLKGVLAYHLEDLRKNVARRDSCHGVDFLNASGDVAKSYAFVNGMLWGLSGIGLFVQSEFDAALEELCSMCVSSHGN